MYTRTRQAIASNVRIATSAGFQIDKMSNSNRARAIQTVCVQILVTVTIMMCAAQAQAAAPAGRGAAIAGYSRHLLQTPPAVITNDPNATCGVTSAQVGAAFDDFNGGLCRNFNTRYCCFLFLEDQLEDGDSSFDEEGGFLPAFQQTCRDRLREVGRAGLCELVQREAVPYGVLQPLLNRCQVLRAPCSSSPPPPPPPPPPACDVSVATVDRAVAVAYDSFRSCGTDGFTRECTDQGVIETYECGQSGFCRDGSRCSFAPSRGSDIRCCNRASNLLFLAVPCLSRCELYRVSREANNFLTVCTDVSAC